MTKSEFRLPAKIETYVDILCDYYDKKNKQDFLEVLTNCKVNIIQDTDRLVDYTLEGYGHDVILSIPKVLFVDILDTQVSMCSELLSKFNQVNGISDEYINRVIFDPIDVGRTPFTPNTSDQDIQRIWKSEGLKIFLSHKVKYKKETTSIKAALNEYGISCFVAHEDITVTSEWQQEIEKALFTMNVLVAVLTEDFHSSPWPDQEVGVAIGRGIHIIPIKIDEDPKGLISKIQAIKINTSKRNWPQHTAKEILKILLTHTEFKNDLQESILEKFANAKSYAEGHEVTTNLLPLLTSISSETASRIAIAFSKNTQLWRAGAVQSTLPAVMQQLTGEEYVIDEKRLIPKPKILI